MRIEEMTRDEFVAAVAKRPVVIVPFGACEAHGPHLPLGTDSYQPEALADEVAETPGGFGGPDGPLRAAQLHQEDARYAEASAWRH